MTRPEGTFLTIDGRPAIRFERRYRHPVERVWRAVTDPAEMARWFPSDVEGDRAVGAALTFVDDAQRAAAREAGEPSRDDGLAFRGTVVAHDPPKVLSFTWGGNCCGSSCCPTATARCSCSPTSSVTSRWPPATAPDRTCASPASTACSAMEATPSPMGGSASTRTTSIVWGRHWARRRTPAE